MMGAMPARQLRTKRPAPPDGGAASMTIRLPDRLPIEPLLPELRQALGKARSLVLEAPPGAGKTTLVPLALLEEPWLAGKRILMLEPRRLAARAAALRMELGRARGGRGESSR